MTPECVKDECELYPEIFSSVGKHRKYTFTLEYRFFRIDSLADKMHDLSRPRMKITRKCNSLSINYKQISVNLINCLLSMRTIHEDIYYWYFPMVQHASSDDATGKECDVASASAIHQQSFIVYYTLNSAIDGRLNSSFWGRNLFKVNRKNR